MSPEERASFQRQLASAVEAAGKRREVVIGYHWHEGRLRAMTAPIKGRAKAAPPPHPVAQAERRKAERGAARYIQDRLL